MLCVLFIWSFVSLFGRYIVAVFSIDQLEFVYRIVFWDVVVDCRSALRITSSGYVDLLSIGGL